MNIKIAIHHYEGDFSDRWIKYCQESNISYELVDCYQNNIIEVMKGFDILLWPWNLSHFESLQFATELIYSVEKMGKIVFPNFKTCYFYDNKVGQKYLLESIEAPVVPSYVFYTKNDAIKWINNTSFPKVFKLSGGAGSMNVKLCRNKTQAKSFVNQAFGKGFSQVDRVAWFQDKVIKLKENPSKISLKNFTKSFGRLFLPTKKEKAMGREKGYIYFQDFMPKNSFDTRIIVIGNKAIALKRLCRDGDFRASGSGKIIYDKNQIDEEFVRISFKTSKDLDVQCMAYDFVYDKNHKPLIVEISYHFSLTAYDDCEGYWDDILNWHDVKINPQYMIMESLLNNIK
jgi:hypothetical protein